MNYGGQGQALYKPAVLWRCAFIIKHRIIKVIGLAYVQQPYLPYFRQGVLIASECHTWNVNSHDYVESKKNLYSKFLKEQYHFKMTIK